MIKNTLVKNFNKDSNYLMNSKAPENNQMLNIHKLPTVMGNDDFNINLKKIKPIKLIKNKK